MTHSVGTHTSSRALIRSAQPLGSRSVSNIVRPTRKAAPGINVRERKHAEGQRVVTQGLLNQGDAPDLTCLQGGSEMFGIWQDTMPQALSGIC